jgi:hypothetical protein
MRLPEAGTARGAGSSAPGYSRFLPKAQRAFVLPVAGLEEASVTVGRPCGSTAGPGTNPELTPSRFRTELARADWGRLRNRTQG